jgi:hypothetical protein
LQITTAKRELLAPEALEVCMAISIPIGTLPLLAVITGFAIVLLTVVDLARQKREQSRGFDVKMPIESDKGTQANE